MWSDYFYFNKSQRIGVLVLLSLILLALVPDWLLPFLSGKDEPDTTAFDKELLEFNNSLAHQTSKSYLHRTVYFTRLQASQPKIVLADFDPNTADSTRFLSLGLKPWMIKNLLKYRSKRGRFRQPSDFSKVYGLTADQFKILKPYIHIASIASKDTLRRKEVFPLKVEKPVIVELNAADSAQLVKVKGIGVYYAKRILGYRKVLGGYVALEQLREVYGMTEENYDKIKSSCSVNASAVRRVCVNSWSVERMAAHPYIRFYKAKAIADLRKKGKIKDGTALLALRDFDKESLERVLPYLSFE
jgi:DNA uptake protein ComE-like DNA-binding protein